MVHNRWQKKMDRRVPYTLLRPRDEYYSRQPSHEVRTFGAKV